MKVTGVVQPASVGGAVDANGWKVTVTVTAANEHNPK